MQVKLKDIKPNPANPRLIKDDKYQKLVKSIAGFPEMLFKRPLVCVTDTDGKLYPLGGNMRLKAIPDALKQMNGKTKLFAEGIPVELADEWTEEQRREFVIKDNVGFGEWDWDALGNEWDAEQLTEWGLDIPNWKQVDEVDYSEKNKEIDLDEFEEKMEFKLKLTSDQFFDLQERLSVVKAKQSVSTNEDAIFELLNHYEASA